MILFNEGNTYKCVLNVFNTASANELLVHGLRALRESLAGDAALNMDNCAAGIVSADEKFRVIEGDELVALIERVAADAAPAAAEPAAAPTGDEPAQSMEE